MTGGGKTTAQTRWWPLVALVCAAGVAMVLWRQGLAVDALLLEYHGAATSWVDEHPWTAALAYVALYAVVIVLALPGGTVMSLAGGYLFGVTTGVGVAMAGAVLGGMLTLWVVHSSLGTWLRRNVGGRYQALRTAFQANPVWYLLMVRLIPVFPFAVVNIIAALLGVRPGMFLWTTVVGLLPSTIALVVMGQGLGAQLDAGKLPGPGILLEPAILWPSLALAGLLLVAWLLRRRWPRP